MKKHSPKEKRWYFIAIAMLIAIGTADLLVGANINDVDLCLLATIPYLAATIMIAASGEIFD